LHRILRVFAILADPKFNPGLLRISKQIFDLIGSYGRAHEGCHLQSQAQQHFPQLAILKHYSSSSHQLD